MPVALYLLLEPLAGYAAVSAVLGPAERHWAEVAGLSIAVGDGLTAAALTAASLAGLPPSPAVLTAWAAVTVVALVGLGWRRRLTRATIPSRACGRLGVAGAVGLVGAVTLVAAVANVWCAASGRGLGDIDEYAIWMFRAKVLAAAPLRPVPAALLDPTLSYSHQDYPPLLPLLAAGAYATIGRVDESAGKGVLPPMYLALIAIVYGAARREVGRGAALAVAAVALAGPVVTKEAGLGVAELPVTLYLGATAALLVRWVEQHARGDLLLAGTCAAAGALSKNEGLAMLPAFGVLAAACAVLGGRQRRRQRLVDVVVATGIALALVGPWLVYRRGLPHTHEDYGARLGDPALLVRGIARLPHVIGSVVGTASHLSLAGDAWALLVVVAALGYRAWGRPATRVLWAALGVQLGLYVLAFLVTPWNLEQLLATVTYRLLAQPSAVVGLLLAHHIRAALAPRSEKPRGPGSTAHGSSG